MQMPIGAVRSHDRRVICHAQRAFGAVADRGVLGRALRQLGLTMGIVQAMRYGLVLGKEGKA
jgi:hypothetical protein